MEMKPRIAGDLTAYLDNFFFPAHVPSRYYRFSYGGLADFFALDTTANSESGPPRNAFEKDGEQFAWLKTNISESRTPWKIPYMHHPPFNAGPRHPSSAKDLEHFIEVFKSSGVKGMLLPATSIISNSANKTPRRAIFAIWYREQAGSSGPARFGMRCRTQISKVGLRSYISCLLKSMAVK